MWTPRGSLALCPGRVATERGRAAACAQGGLEEVDGGHRGREDASGEGVGFLGWDHGIVEYIYIYIGLIFGGSNLSRFNKRCSIGKVQLSLDDNHDMFFVVFCI